jgi:hypothetical protein
MKWNMTLLMLCLASVARGQEASPKTVEQTRQELRQLSLPEEYLPAEYRPQNLFHYVRVSGDSAATCPKHVLVQPPMSYDGSPAKGLASVSLVFSESGFTRSYNEDPASPSPMKHDKDGAPVEIHEASNGQTYHLQWQPPSFKERTVPLVMKVDLPGKASASCG